MVAAREPALRSLVLGLLDFGRDERVNDFAYEDQTYLANVDLVAESAGKLPGAWATGIADEAATRELLRTYREATPHQSCRWAWEEITAGKTMAATIWDVAHLAAGELMMRQPGIYGIHTVTSVNALHYAFRMAATEDTRLLLLLQALGWMTQFRQFMGTREQGIDDMLDIDQLAPLDLPAGEVAAAEAVLAETSVDRATAARRALAYGQQYAQPETLLAGARRLVFAKGTDAHDYKYPVAIFEDHGLVSPSWRPHMLATATYHLPSPATPDSPLMQRAVEAVRGL